MSKKTSALRGVIVTVLAFALAVLLTLSSLLVVIKATLVSPDYMASQLTKSGYAQLELARIKEGFVSYGIPSNVEESFFDSFFASGVVSEQTVAEDMGASVRSLYTEAEPAENEYFRADLGAALYEYAASREMDLENEDVVAGIDEFADSLIRIYADYVTFPFDSTIRGYMVRLSPLLIPMAGILAALILICVVVIVFSYKRKVAPASYIGCSFAASALMLLVAPIVASASGIIENFSLTDDALRAYFIQVMNGFLNSIIISGAVLAVLAIIMFVLTCALTKKKKA